MENAKVTKNCDGVGGGLKNAKVINWKMQKLQKIGWGGVFKNAEVIKQENAKVTKIGFGGGLQKCKSYRIRKCKSLSKWGLF